MNIQDIKPDEIAIDWSNRLLSAMNLAMDNGKKSLEIGGRFQVVYEIDRWIDALNQASKIYEQAEKYEECLEIQELIYRVEIIQLVKH